MEKIFSLVRKYIPLALIAGIVVVLDQWSKNLIRTTLEIGESITPFPDIAPIFRIIHWKNTGAAFGIFPEAGLLFTVVAVLVALAIIYYWPRITNDQVALKLALALQLGGAMGNLTSRLTVGVVTDIFAVGKFPVFNVADSSISIGVAVLIAATWWEERQSKANAEIEGKSNGEPRIRPPEVDANV